MDCGKVQYDDGEMKAIIRRIEASRGSDAVEIAEIEDGSFMICKHTDSGQSAVHMSEAEFWVLCGLQIQIHDRCGISDKAMAEMFRGFKIIYGERNEDKGK